MDLLPENIAKRSPIWPLTYTMKPGVGCLTAFIGLRGTAEELGLKAENLWIFTESSGSKVMRFIFKSYDNLILLFFLIDIRK
jgi:hypothetical protein